MADATIVLRQQADMTTRPEDVERQLGILERAWDNGFVRKTVLIAALAIIWELYARYLDQPLLMPTLSETIQALIVRVQDG
ncbi:hypothetical protein ABTE00_21290, partial [Acinetobacter baumannii]